MSLLTHRFTDPTPLPVCGTLSAPGSEVTNPIWMGFVLVSGSAETVDIGEMSS
ncbi:MAG: hypothetical protein HYX59_03945 [Elusimicrobia bacterium]|nr:hypothetical protein [Elusimicrobiota bacterium]